MARPPAAPRAHGSKGPSPWAGPGSQAHPSSLPLTERLLSGGPRGHALHVWKRSPRSGQPCGADTSSYRCRPQHTDRFSHLPKDAGVQLHNDGATHLAGDRKSSVNVIYFCSGDYGSFLLTRWGSGARWFRGRGGTWGRSGQEGAPESREPSLPPPPTFRWGRRG